MEYMILFLEGIITFISPCLLPMLPIYITYFVGEMAEGEERKDHKTRALINSIGFVIGFSIVFILLGAAAGSIGKFLFEHNRLINIITGFIVVLFGLSYIGVIKLSILNQNFRAKNDVEPVKFGKAILFGMIFSIGWTPCVGTFLGSALLIAANSQTVLKGSLMLLCFSLGLGIPFILSAVLLENMIGAIQWIKKNYNMINKIAGGFLVLVGLSMITGLFARLITTLM